MPTESYGKHYVAVIAIRRRRGDGMRGHRNIWATATFSYICCVQHMYDYTNPGAREPVAPFPLWTEHMARRLLEYFGGVLPTQCIVNEYRPGQGIGMHADHRDFGRVVASLSLADDWPMRFRPRNARPYVRHGVPGDRVLTLPRRSVLVLRQRARAEWMHGIDPSDTANRRATRVSATFRTLAG